MTYNNDKSANYLHCWLVLLFLLLIVNVSIALADEGLEDWNIGGHLKYFISHSQYDDDNIFSQAGSSSPTDQSFNLRLTAKKRWESNWDVNIHYELGAHNSDSIKAARNFGAQLTLSGLGAPSDDARLFDLTNEITDKGKKNIFHRLDRASIGYSEKNHVVRFGRQAVSWGNGMVFQPMDIFNPFSPTAIDKEYKTGDDMFYMQNLFTSGDDLQTVLIPRRKISTGKLETDESSLALKYHTIKGDIDIDILAARHFDDDLLGFGFSANWQGAVIRGDLLNAWDSSGSTLSGIIGINYGWVWNGHNFTGFLEYYRNGYGIDDGNYSTTALANNPSLVSRVSRGEIFTLAKEYLTAGLSVELTPRWIFNPLLINNLNDSSWLTQWTATFDWQQNLTLQLGANLPLGNKGDEYGGIPSSTAGVYIGGGRSIYTQLSYYF